MIIDNNSVKAAKESLGIKAAEIINRDLNLNKWESRNLKGCCPIHNEKTPSFVWDKKKNFFKCFGCGATYDIVDHYISYYNLTFVEAIRKLFDETNTNYDFEDYVLRDKNIKNEDKKPYKFPKSENKSLDTVIEYLHLRGFTDEAIRYSGVKSDNHGNIAYEYKNENGTLLSVKYRPARKLKKGDNKCWFQKGSDTSPVLWGMENIDTTKPLIISEGETDRIAIITAGYRNVVSVPTGAGNYKWIEFNYEWLEQFEEILIWGDNDEAGQKMSFECVGRLGEERCKVIKAVNRKDANEVLFRDGVEEVRNCIESATYEPIKDIVDMADVEDYDINKVEKISSGYEGLDKYIRGFVMPSLNVITGVNSSGKSTLINQMCVSEPLNQGYKVFIFSGELSLPQLRSWIEFPMAGNNLLTVQNPRGYMEYSIPKDVKEKMRNWYRGHVFMYDNEEDYSEDNIFKKMEQVAKKYGAKVFIIDNLMMVNLNCRSSELNLKQKEFVLRLKKFSRRFNAVVHLVAHPRKLDVIKRLSKLDVAGSGDITNLADYVMAVHRVTDKEKEDEKDPCPYDCILDLFKNRPASIQDKAIGLNYQMGSRRFYGQKDNPNKKYEWTKSKFEIENDLIEDEEVCPF